MTPNDERPDDGRERIQPGALGAWWRQGARSAFLLRPRWDGLQVTPSLIAALVLLPFLIDVCAQRLYVDGPAFFHWPALQAGWLSTVIAVWWCWLLVPQPAGGRAGDGPPSAAALFSMLAAQALTISVVTAAIYVPLLHNGVYSEQVFGRWGFFAVSLAPMAWTVAAGLRLIWATAARVGPRIVAAAAMVGVMAFGIWHEPMRLWHPERQESRAEPFVLTQEITERQAGLLGERLQALRPQRPGVIDVYTITFAPYADEDVFRLESERVASVMQERFDAAGQTLQLVNHRQTVIELPWATPLNLQRAVERVAALMDRDEDVLLIHLTSHGAADGELAVRLWPLQIEPVTPALLKQWLDGAGIRWRIVSVSACYSGSWIAPLAEPGTLVMTAADAEHTSFGCGRNSSLTYFGRAMFDEQLRHTWSFEQAHAEARRVIEQREREAGKSDGYSNPQIQVGGEIRAQLAELEAQRLRSPRP
jgi:hypothetical protein